MKDNIWFEFKGPEVNALRFNSGIQIHDADDFSYLINYCRSIYQSMQDAPEQRAAVMYMDVKRVIPIALSVNGSAELTTAEIIDKDPIQPQDRPTSRHSLVVTSDSLGMWSELTYFNSGDHTAGYGSLTINLTGPGTPLKHYHWPSVSPRDVVAAGLTQIASDVHNILIDVSRIIFETAAQLFQASPGASNYCRLNESALMYQFFTRGFQGVSIGYGGRSHTSWKGIS